MRLLSQTAFIFVDIGFKLAGYEFRMFRVEGAQCKVEKLRVPSFKFSMSHYFWSFFEKMWKSDMYLQMILWLDLGGSHVFTSWTG